jgi:uncharacterized protein (TIGR02145 family)
MGYSCAAAVNLKIDGIESQELNSQLKEVLSTTIEYLRNNVVNIKKDYDNSWFFTDMEFYSSFYRDNEKAALDHAIMKKIIPYKGDYELEPFLQKHDNYIYSPEEVLQLFLLCFFLSKKIPSAKIYLGLGDVALFWLNLELMDGEVTDINFETENNYDEESWGFRCEELEMRQFFISQNCLWMEANKVDAILISEFFHDKWKEQLIKALENDPYLMEDADESIKKDRNLVMRLMQKNPYILSDADESLRDDRELAEMALLKRPNVYLALSDRLKKDRELALLALKLEDGSEIFAEIAENFATDRDIILKAVEKNNGIYSSLIPEFKKDQEILLTALKCCPYTFIGAEILEDAVDTGFLSDADFMKMAIDVNSESFLYLDESLKDNEELSLFALKRDGLLIKDCISEFKGRKEFAIEALKNNGLAIEFLNESLKMDDELVSIAVKQSGEALLHVDASYRDKEDLVISAFETLQSNLKNEEYHYEKPDKRLENLFLSISERLRNDTDFVSRITKDNLNLLQFLDDKFKRNKEFIGDLLTGYSYYIFDSADYFAVWMTENLNVDRFQNGDPIPEVRSKADWLVQGQSDKACYCYYENNPENGKKYGKMYNWMAINDNRGLIPDGWKIPESYEWSEMIKTIFKIDDFNDTNKKNKKLKQDIYLSLTDKDALNLLNGGYRKVYNVDDFSGIGEMGVYWCSDHYEKRFEPKEGESMGDSWCFNISDSFHNHLSSMEAGAYIRLKLKL